MALTTQASVKLHLGITGTTEDTYLDMLIEQVDQLIKSYVGQTIERQTVTEYHAGNNTPLLVTRQRPVASLTSVRVDAYGAYGQASDPFPAATLQTAGIDYALRIDRPDGTSRSGIVQRLNGVWPAVFRRQSGLLTPAIEPGQGNIKIVYVAGYLQVPKDLELAANTLIGSIRHNRRHGAGQMTSESYQGYSYSLQLSESLLDPVKHILANYKTLRF